MSDPVVMVAVREALSAISGLPKVYWPNEELGARAPFLIFDTGPTTGTPITLSGQERFEFRPQVSYMARLGDYTADSDAALWAVAQAFKFGTKIYSDGVQVAYCLQTPVADGGFPDGSFYRRNMTLRIASDQQI